MIRASLGHMKAIEEILVTLEQKIQETIGLHFKEEYDLLRTIPAVKDSASVIIAEIGSEHGPFCNRYAHFIMVRDLPRQQRKRGEEKTGDHHTRQYILKKYLRRVRMGGNKDERHLPLCQIS